MSACTEVLASICADDLAVMVNETRTDCPGRIVSSGITRRDADMDTLANGGTWQVNKHFWSYTKNQADTTGFPGRTDQTCPPCDTVGQKESSARKFLRSKCWEIRALDEQCNITNQSAEDLIMTLLPEWALDTLEADIVHALIGAYLNSKTLCSGDLIYDADVVDGKNKSPGFMGMDAVLEAASIMGCKRFDLNAMLVHADVYRSMEKQGLIAMYDVECSDDEACLQRSYLNNIEILEIDDSLAECMVDPVSGAYISILFRPGAVSWGVGTPPHGNMEMDNDPTADCGAGARVVQQREQYSLAIVGYRNNFDRVQEARLTADPTYEVQQNMITPEMKDPAMWCRVYELKNMPFVFITSSEQDP